MPSLILENQTINYKIRRSKRIKNLKISIKPNREIFISIPSYLPNLVAKHFLKENTNWVLKKLSESEALKPQINFTKEPKLNFLGKKFYQLKILSGQGKRNLLQEHFTELHFFKGSKSAELQKEIQRHLEIFYKKKAHNYLEKRVLFFTEKLKVKHNKIFIKNQKTRWGSCSSKNNLNFNWRIMFATKKIIDYLVIHEVCHLKEMNHGKKFWKLVEKLDPDFKIHRNFLNKSGKTLSF